MNSFSYDKYIFVLNGYQSGYHSDIIYFDTTNDTINNAILDGNFIIRWQVWEQYL